MNTNYICINVNEQKSFVWKFCFYFIALPRIHVWYIKVTLNAELILGGLIYENEKNYATWPTVSKHMRYWVWVFWWWINFKNNNFRVLESPNHEDISVRGSPYYMNPDVFAHIQYNSKVRIFYKDKFVQHHTCKLNQCNTLIFNFFFINFMLSYFEWKLQLK